MMKSALVAVLTTIVVPSLNMIMVTANDLCENAVVVDTIPFGTMDDTTDATIDFPTPKDSARNLTCGLTVVGRGVWYQIEGDDTFLQAKVDTSSDELRDGRGPAGDAMLDWNIKTALFELNNPTPTDQTCNIDNLECMTTYQYALLDERTTTPTSQWFAKSGTNYLLHVSGAKVFDHGPFLLEITPLDGPSRPVNDQCETALWISEDDKDYHFSGSSISAWPHSETAIDCGIRDGSRGLFYQVNGTGAPMTLTMKDIMTGQPEEQIPLEYADLTNTTLPTTATSRNGAVPSLTAVGGSGRYEIAVMSSVGGSNGCSDLQCEIYSDYIYGDTDEHTVYFPTEVNTTYTILVTGESFAEVATFSLHLEQHREYVDKTPNDNNMSSSASSLSSVISSPIMMFESLLLLLVTLNFTFRV